MNLYSTTAPYPLSAFHLVTREAIEEVLRNVQAPDSLVAMEFLANMSAAAQGIYDVRLPTGQECPISLYLTVLAESGERKTAVHKLVALPLYEFDQMRLAKHDADLEQYKLNMVWWEAVEKGLRRKITKLAQDGEEIDETCRQLAEHAAAKLSVDTDLDVAMFMIDEGDWPRRTQSETPSGVDAGGVFALMD